MPEQIDPWSPPPGYTDMTNDFSPKALAVMVARLAVLLGGRVVVNLEPGRSGKLKIFAPEGGPPDHIIIKAEQTKGSDCCSPNGCTCKPTTGREVPE